MHDINSLTNQYVRLFVLRLIIPVNNFSAMSERDGQIGVHKKSLYCICDEEGRIELNRFTRNTKDCQEYAYDATRN